MIRYDLELTTMYMSDNKLADIIKSDYENATDVTIDIIESLYERGCWSYKQRLYMETVVISILIKNEEN